MNKAIIAYRINFEHLEYGSKVPISKHFYNNLPPNKALIENIFEENKPENKPSRFNTIFVFKEEKDALFEFKKISCGFLYKVNVVLNSSSHEGDWMWLEEAKKKLVETKTIVEYAKKYWQSVPNEEPIFEYLVEEAIVIEEIIVEESEKRAFKEKRYGLPSPEEIAEGYGSWEPPRLYRVLCK